MNWKNFFLATLIAGLIMGFLILVGELGRANAQDAAIGDSIALGAGQALGVKTFAQQNVGSCYILGHMPVGPFDHVVISAGINDPPGSCLGAIREKVRARSVTWIVPAPINSAYNHVINVAAAHGDRTVAYLCWHGCTAWNFHPASYRAVANAVRATWNGNH